MRPGAVAARGAGALAAGGAAYVAALWDSKLFAKDNIVCILLRAIGFWPRLINASEKDFRRVADANAGMERTQVEADVKKYGYQTETLRVPVEGGDIDVKLHRPKAAKGPVPLLIWYHGGGMCIGTADDAFMTSGVIGIGLFAHFAGRAAIASVDYRRAPEHKFPTGVEDSIAAAQYLAAHATKLGCDPDRIGIAGFSAGGYLAACVHQAARDRGFPLRAAGLFAPMARRGCVTRSFLENGHYPALTTQAMVMFWNHYCPDPTSDADPRCTIIHGVGSGHLAPAVVLTNQYDALRDEGIEYYNALKKAGVTAQHISVRGTHVGGPGADAERMGAALNALASAMGVPAQAKI